MESNDKQAEFFEAHLDRLYTSWNKEQIAWNAAGSLAFVMGDLIDESYVKSSAIQLFLFGKDLGDTLLLFTSNKLYILTKDNQINDFFNPLLQCVKQKKIDISCIPYKNPDSFNFLDKLSLNNVGILENDGKYLSGNFYTLFKNKITKYKTCDVSTGLSILLSIKDNKEIGYCTNAAKITSKWMSNIFITEMENIIEKETKMSHSDLSQKVEAKVHDPKSYHLNAKSSNVDSCYTPIIQSGGKYNLKPSAQSNQDNLSSDTIICSMGAKYRNYCANVSRTFMIDPTPYQRETYEIVYEGYRSLEPYLRPGVTLSEIRINMKSHLEKHNSKLLENLTANNGFGLGLEFRENYLLIKDDNNVKLREGMILYLCVGLFDIPFVGNPQNKLTSFSLLIGDTFYINSGECQRLTNVKRTWEEIHYYMRIKVASKPTPEALIDVVGPPRTRNWYKADEEKEKLLQREKRKEHQNDLMIKKAQQHLKSERNDNDDDDEETDIDKVADLQSYKNSKEFPKEGLKNQIYVDQKNECVFMPINGIPVPFHISTIKNVTKTGGDELGSLRFNFYTPTTSPPHGIDLKILKAWKMNPLSLYIKQVNVRVNGSQRLESALMCISNLIKDLKARIIRDDNEQNLVEQEGLILSAAHQQIPRLRGLNMRPTISGRLTAGYLEAHENGFRFRTEKTNELQDILYSNIKHAIFKRCDDSNLLVILHFHLRNPIMIGKKKSIDVQFYTAAADVVVNLDQNKRSSYDMDEIEQEDRERAMRKNLNKMFWTFAKNSEKVAEKFNFEFEKPYKMGFYGTPDKEMVYIQPTINCLMNVSNNPFFVVSMGDVEHVHFERIISGRKEFDLCLIFKDYKRSVIRLSAININHLDIIQEWLDNISITYTEGSTNLNWKEVILAADDPYFWKDVDENGDTKLIGWSQLDANAEEEEDSAQGSASSDYGDDDGNDDSGSDESEEVGENSDEEVELDPEDDDDEEPPEEEESDEEDDWDEIDRKAAEADRLAAKRERTREMQDSTHINKKRR